MRCLRCSQKITRCMVAIMQPEPITDAGRNLARRLPCTNCKKEWTSAKLRQHAEFRRTIHGHRVPSPSLHSRYKNSSVHPLRQSQLAGVRAKVKHL